MSPKLKHEARVYFAGHRGWIAEALRPYYMATRVIGSGKTISEAENMAIANGYTIVHKNRTCWNPDNRQDLSTWQV